MKKYLLYLGFLALAVNAFAEVRDSLPTLPTKLSTTAGVAAKRTNILPTLGSDGKWAYLTVGAIEDSTLNYVIKNDILFVIGTLSSTGNSPLYRNRLFCENNQQQYVNGVVTGEGKVIRFSQPVDLSGYLTIANAASIYATQNGVNGALVGKANLSDLASIKAVRAGDGVAVDSSGGAYSVSIPTLNALTTAVFSKASNAALSTLSGNVDTAKTNIRNEMSNNINYVRAISDMRDDSLKAVLNAKTQPDWNAVSGFSQILNKPIGLDSTRFLKRYSITTMYKNQTDTIVRIAKITSQTGSVALVTAATSTTVSYYQIPINNSISENVWYAVSSVSNLGSSQLDLSIMRIGNDYYLKGHTNEFLAYAGFASFWSQQVVYDVVMMKSDASIVNYTSVAGFSANNSNALNSTDNRILEAGSPVPSLSTEIDVVRMVGNGGVSVQLQRFCGQGKTYSIINNSAGIVIVKDFSNVVLKSLAVNERVKICLINNVWVEIN